MSRTKVYLLTKLKTGRDENLFWYYFAVSTESHNQGTSLYTHSSKLIDDREHGSKDITIIYYSPYFL